MWIFTPPILQTARLEARPTDHPGIVRAIGDFNHWEAPGVRMDASADGTVWRLSLKLEPDVYNYVILENGDTLPTGDALKEATRQWVVTPPDYAKRPAIRNDGVITVSAVRHRPDKDVEQINDRTFSLTLRVRKDDVRSVSVNVIQAGSDQKTYPLALKDSNPLYDFYKVKIVVDPAVPFQYRFFLNDGEGGRAFDQAGLSQGIIGGMPFSHAAG